MVRHKIRWLLIGLEFESDLDQRSSVSKTKGHTNTKKGIIEKAHVFRELAKSLTILFGLSAHSIIPDINVRHVDGQIVMIRVPRDVVGKVRTAVTYITELNKEFVACSVLSVNGSARTARLASMREIRKREIKSVMSMKKLKQLDARLQVVRLIE